MAKSSGGLGASLKGMSLAAIQAEISRRQRGVKKLVAKRSKLAAKVAALDAQIAELGGDSGVAIRISKVGGRRMPLGPRPRNAMNLVDTMHKVLDKPMGVLDIIPAVKKAGYKTSAANFRTIVNQTLINSGKFKRVSRGVYARA